MEEHDENEGQTPLYAEVRESTNNKCSVVRFTLFGKVIEHAVTGDAHGSVARHVAESWNTHFQKEWFQVRQITSVIMSGYTEALSKYGVPDEVLKKALAEVVNDAG